MPRYRRSPRLAVRAFFLTDRTGHTLSSLLGLGTLIRWWTLTRLRRRLAKRR